ncbi:Smr/MutS family protein [Patescibacteria group bacterium]|nr:Smr/MutS family protein [Patescibacteria group bacterium]
MGRRKKKQGNKYAELAEPQSTLDFHGRGILMREEIVTMLNEFIEGAVLEGLEHVIIVTGKGLHSHGGESVIRPIVNNFLSEHDSVKSFGNAAMNRGGSGAVEVKLY